MPDESDDNEINNIELMRKVKEKTYQDALKIIKDLPDEPDDLDKITLDKFIEAEKKLAELICSLMDMTRDELVCRYIDKIDPAKRFEIFIREFQKRSERRRRQFDFERKYNPDFNQWMLEQLTNNDEGEQDEETKSDEDEDELGGNEAQI